MSEAIDGAVYVSSWLPQNVSENTFALFYGSQYYPRPGWMDFRGIFSSVEDAVKEANICMEHIDTPWFQVVDLRAGKVVAGYEGQCIDCSVNMRGGICPSCGHAAFTA